MAETPVALPTTAPESVRTQGVDGVEEFAVTGWASRVPAPALHESMPGWTDL